jgi:TIR domain
MSRKRSLAPGEIFLSYSSQNLAFAKRLARSLAERNIKSFLARHSIRGAQEWHDEIGAALRRCDWFLVILSPQSLRSRWVKRELIYALQARHYDGRIVPVRYKTCDFEELSWALPSLQSVDFRKSFDEGWRQLLRIWSLS